MDNKSTAYEWLSNLYKSGAERNLLFRERKNIISYAASASESFRNKEFNAIDSLVLSQFAYLYFDDLIPGLTADAKPIRIGELTHKKDIDKLYHHVRDVKSNRRLFGALVDSPRFRDVEMTFYVNKVDFKKEKQFSALTYLLDDGTAYIAYRGTDSTFVGWKEDFNMIFTSPVPAQEEGVKYLNSVGKLMSCDFKVGGHSKGGNIAVYSSLKCHQPLQNRITHVFNHDGPGFREEIFKSQGYHNMKDKIYQYLPQSALVGMLLQQQENYIVIKSNRMWIAQHDPFSWIIDGEDFQYLETIKNSAAFFNKTLNDWLGSLDDEKRELFVDTLFHVVYAADAETIYDLTGDWHKRAIAVLGAIKGIDNETRKFILQTINALFVLGIRNLRGKK